jgi:hypothetical protein
MRRPGPNQLRWRRLCLEVLPSRPTWTLRELAELGIGLTPVAAERTVLRLEEAGLVHVDRPPDDTWRISLAWGKDLEPIDKWIQAEFENQPERPID